MVAGVWWCMYPEYEAHNCEHKKAMRSGERPPPVGQFWKIISPQMVTSEKFWGNSCAVSLCLVAIVHPHPPNDLFWHCPTLQPLLSGRFMHFSSCPRMLHYKRPDRARRSPLPCWLPVMNRWLSYHSRRIPRPRFFGTELNQVLAYLHV